MSNDMTTTAARRFVERRHPEADVYPASYDSQGREVGPWVVFDDADQNDDAVNVLGTGATAAEAWASAARALGSKR